MDFSKLRKVSAALASAGLMTIGTSASAIVVGGVDFGPQGLLSHLETTTLAETLITDNGQILSGYGQVNTVNGNVLYGGNPTDRLYFTFTGFESVDFSGASTGFTGGVVDVYYGSTFNLLNQSSAANLATIQAMTPWLRLNAESALYNGANVYSLFAEGTLVGTELSFGGEGLLSVDTSGAFGIAAVADFLDVNNRATGLGTFADITLTTSGSNGGIQGAGLNVNDDLTGCFDGTAQAGQWCIAGSADLRGDTNVVSAPGTLALSGIALLGLGALRRRRS